MEKVLIENIFLVLENKFYFVILLKNAIQNGFPIKLGMTIREKLPCHSRGGGKPLNRIKI